LAHPLQKYDIISIFKMAAVSHVVLALGNGGPPTKCLLWSVLKSLVRRVNSSEDIAMYKFWRFGLKLPIHSPFRSFWGIFRHLTLPIILTPKSTVLGRKHIVCIFKNRSNCSTWARDEKNTGQQKSDKSVIFPLFGGSPHWTDSTQKWHGG